MRFVYRAGTAVAALAFLAVAGDRPAEAAVVKLDGTRAVAIRGLDVGDHRVNIRFDGRSFDEIKADTGLATPFPFLGADFAAARPVLDSIAQLLNESGATKLLDPLTGASGFRGVTPTREVNAFDPAKFIGPEIGRILLNWRFAEGVTLPRDQPVGERGRLFMIFSLAEDVPEPAGIALMALGLTVLAGTGPLRRRRGTQF